MKRMWLIVALAIIGATSAPTTYGADITLSWTAPGDDGPVGTATAFELRYASSKITAQNWDQATLVSSVPRPAAGGTVQTFTITNLDPGRKIYFAIKAVDEAGNWSLLSNNAVCGNCNCLNLTGNVNNDQYDDVTIADLSELVNYLYMGQSSVPCPLEANINGDPEGSIDMTDLSLLVGYLFRDANTYRPAPCQ